MISALELLEVYERLKTPSSTSLQRDIIIRAIKDELKRLENTEILWSGTISNVTNGAISVVVGEGEKIILCEADPGKLYSLFYPHMAIMNPGDLFSFRGKISETYWYETKVKVELIEVLKPVHITLPIKEPVKEEPSRTYEPSVKAKNAIPATLGGCFIGGLIGGALSVVLAIVGLGEDLSKPIIVISMLICAGIGFWLSRYVD